MDFDILLESVSVLNLFVIVVLHIMFQILLTHKFVVNHHTILEI